MAYCINHSGMVAVVRCRQCSKPLCQECKKITKEGIFCSEKCHEAAKVFLARMEEIEARRGPERKGILRWIRGLLKLLAFVLIIWAIFHFGLKIKSFQDLQDFISSGIKKIPKGFFRK